jgi:hypothetical protein
VPTGQQYSSVATQAQLTAGIGSSNPTCSVNTASGFPSTPFTGVLDIGTASQEIVDVTNVSGLTLTITRGVDGSAATTHANGATFTHSAIGRDFREARSHIDASGSNDASGHAVHGLQVGSNVVGTNDTQTLTNKTLTSPTVNNETSSNPTITGTVGGNAQYNNISVSTAAVGSIPLTIKGIASETADLLRIQDSTPTNLFKVTANGATGAGAVSMQPTDTGTDSLTINSPSGLSGNIANFGINSVSKVHIGGSGTLSLTPGPLSVGGLTGAATTTRYVGGTAGGPPSSGTFSTGDFVIDTANGILWTCTAGGTPGTWKGSGEAQIANSILGGTSASVTFSSIPQYFNHLRVAIIAKTNSATLAGYDNLQLQINGVSTANYNGGQEFETVGSSTVTGFTTSGSTASIIGSVWGSHFATQGAGVVECKIPYYSTTTFGKAWTSQSFTTDGGSTGIKQTLGAAFATATSTAAVTSITISASAGSFVAGSAFFLYGVE